MYRNEVDQTDDNALRTLTSCHDAHCHRAVIRMFFPLYQLHMQQDGAVLCTFLHSFGSLKGIILGF